MALDAAILTVQDDALAESLVRRGLRVIPATDADIALALESAGVSPAQCVLIADSAEAIAGARLMGLVSLGLLTGGDPMSALRSAGARAVYDNTCQLNGRLDDALRSTSPGAIHLTFDVMHSLMRHALRAADDAIAKGEAPIGCALARGDGSIIVTAHNEQNATQNKTAHAEIVAFARAAGQIPIDARDLIMISTLEPCVMCTGAAMESAVDTIIFALPAPDDAGTTRVTCPTSPETQMPRIIGNVLADESRALFEAFLKTNPRPQQAKFVKQLLRHR